jgi:hypothetical protein
MSSSGLSKHGTMSSFTAGLASERQVKTLTNGGVATGKYKRSTMTAWSTDITFLDPDVLEWTVQAHHQELFPQPERHSKTLTNGGMEL